MACGTGSSGGADSGVPVDTSASTTNAAQFVSKINYSVSGTFTVNGQPVSGVTLIMDLGNGQTATAVTDASGKYTFSNVPTGTYSIVVSSSSYSIVGTTNSFPVTVSGGNVTSVNIPAITVLGTVLACPAGQVGTQGVCSPAAYRVAGTLTFTSQGKPTEDVGTTERSAMGHARTISCPVNSTTVTLSGGKSASTTSASSGTCTATYSFTNLGNASYTVTPTVTGWTFSPLSQTKTISGANQDGVNLGGSLRLDVARSGIVSSWR
jgi:hypothetical protein